MTSGVLALALLHTYAVMCTDAIHTQSPFYRLRNQDTAKIWRASCQIPASVYNLSSAIGSLGSLSGSSVSQILSSAIPTLASRFLHIPRASHSHGPASAEFIQDLDHPMIPGFPQLWATLIMIKKPLPIMRTCEGFQ